MGWRGVEWRHKSLDYAHRQNRTLLYPSGMQCWSIDYYYLELEVASVCCYFVFTQDRQHEWENYQAVGVGEIRKLSTDNTVHSVFEAMGAYLWATIAQRDLSEKEEASLMQPVNLFESPSQWGKYHNDVKIYVEACLAHAVTGILAQFLITNDHWFFKMFLRSAVAEDTLHLVATDKLEIQEGVRVKLLGEVIHGL